jgi:hypothetical protein
MNRRAFFYTLWGTALGGAGCRSVQRGKVMTPEQGDMVGSHAAGAEVYKPLIEDALGKLLARQAPTVQPVGVPQPALKKIVFVGLENKSSEELGDFKDQIVQVIDTKINQSGVFQQVSGRFVDAGLKATRLRPDELFLPANQRAFLAVMESQGQPFDYLLFANLTSGTTRDNSATQKDYLLTFELVNLQTGAPDKECAHIRKGYRKTHGW